MVDIPTTQESVNATRIFLETALAQNSPLVDKSLIEVLSRNQGMTKTELYQFMIERITQVLATEATGDDLVKLADAYRVFRKAGQKTTLVVRLPGTDGTEVPATSTWLGVANDERYFQNISFTVSGEYADVTITAENIGVAGNIQAGSTVQFLSDVTVEGLSSEGAVQSITTNGAEVETIEELRIRLLDRLRVETGGSNQADVRTWGQEEPNVFRVYPYSGSEPYNESEPGERTVYVHATESYDSDGYADQALLDGVRSKITTDPTTGKARQCLGSVDSILDVKSITRRHFYITVFGLNVDVARIDNAQRDIEIAISDYRDELACYVDGLDAPIHRNDTITSVAASDKVQDVLRAYSGYATSVTFGVQPGNYLSSYTLVPGEFTDLTVLYV